MKQPTPWWMWLLPLPVVWWAALLTAGAWQPGMDLLQLMAGLSTVLQRPWDIRWTQYSGRCLLLFTLAYAVGIGMALSNTTATRRGEEHGSARWGMCSVLPGVTVTSEAGTLSLRSTFPSAGTDTGTSTTPMCLWWEAQVREKHVATVCRTYWKQRAGIRMHRPVPLSVVIPSRRCCAKRARFSLHGAMRCGYWT